MQRYYTLFFLSLFFFTSCNLKTDEKINAKVVNETIRKRKIKRVLEDDIVSTAYGLGQTAADTALTLLPKAGAELCQLFDFTKEMPEPMQKWVNRAVIRCSPDFFHHPKEKEIWEAYAQAMEEDIEVKGSVQRLGNKQSYQQLAYTQPIKYTVNGEPQWAMLSIILDKSAVILQYQTKK